MEIDQVESGRSRVSSTKCGSNSVGKLRSAKHCNHFAYEFQRPSSSVIEDRTLSAEFMAEKLSIHNCEWMCRPLIAASQLRLTLTVNDDLLTKLKLLSRALMNIKNTSAKSQKMNAHVAIECFGCNCKLVEGSKVKVMFLLQK